MKTTDQIEKIKAVVLYILKQIPEGVDYIHLFKIMYFAQQEHLVTYGMPLVEDTFVARKHGPVALWHTKRCIWPRAHKWYRLLILTVL